jgi:phosphoribosylanthranilate isomerase
MDKINLQHCTFTGVDQSTSLADLASLSKMYSFIEWGFLFSTSENAAFSRLRYPTIEWFNTNIEQLQKISHETGASLALHVCGKETKNLLQQTPSALLELLPFFNRVQINFRYKNQDLGNVEKLLDKYSEITFITQHNKANEDLYTKIHNVNHQVLFDLSGGRGVSTEDWLDPLPHKVCGYAGGLGPDNIVKQFDSIHTVVKDKLFWIDMEGQVRTNDLLDLNKCYQVAHYIKEKLYLNSHEQVVGIKL